MGDERGGNRDLIAWLGLRGAPDWRVARPLGPFLTFVFTLLFGLALVAAFGVLIGVIFGGGEVTLGAGALIAALLGAPFVIWGTVLRHQTVTFQKEGHMTDRINKAVEQLGMEKVVKRHLVNSRGKKVYQKSKDGKPDYARPVSVEESAPNIEVRIGAILSLERIAQDSTRHDNGRDHVRVMEILCAYIRENSNARAPAEYPLPEWTPLPDEPNEEERAEQTKWRTARFGGVVEMDEGIERFAPNARDWAQSLPKPRADVQLALTVIGRRSAEQRRVEAAWPDPPTEVTEWPFDTKCPRLAYRRGMSALAAWEIADEMADAIEAYRELLAAWKNKIGDYRGYRLDLRGTNLQRADMAAKQPQGADAVFSGARLEGARADGADLEGARMLGVNLGRARMDGADLRHARMDGADLRHARMEGADLRRTEIDGADLRWSRIDGSDLRWSQMDGADVRRARIEEVDLAEAQTAGGRGWRGSNSLRASRR